MPVSFLPFSELPDPDISRRNLPHWSVAGATYFVTFRMADSLPAGALAEIERSCAAWLHHHGLQDRREIESLPWEARQEFRRLITRAEERWLDAGYGSCALRKEECRCWIVEALHTFAEVRYALDRCVVMPNHVHALVQPINGHILGEIISSWKKFSALRINRTLQRSGTFWQHESFDHIVRDRPQLERFRKYITDNPQKANLREGEYYSGAGSGIL